MAGSHGGPRPGSGRKPNVEKFADVLATCNGRLAEAMPEVVEALIRLAVGKAVSETWVPAGTVTRKDVLRKPPKEKDPSEAWKGDDAGSEEPDDDDDGVWLDQKGKPVLVDVPLYPWLEPHQLVLVERKTITPDIKALAYVWDRLQGKPAQFVPPDPESLDLEKALKGALAILATRKAAAAPTPAEPADDGRYGQ